MAKIRLFPKKNIKSKTLLTDFIYTQIISKTRRNNKYKRAYRNTCDHIQRFQAQTGINLCVENFTTRIAEEFIYYLRTNGRMKGVKKHGAGLMQNTVVAILDKIKSSLSKAKRQGYSVSYDLDIDIKLEDANAVYLNVEELIKINNLQTLSKEAQAVRDMFLVGCFTGMRFSDYSKLTTDNIIKKDIHVKTRKTGERVVIPMHPIISRILDRNNGSFPRLKSEQAFNMCLKRICKKAKITDEILYERTIGTKVVRKRMKKYELVTSHTARRSAATNMYLAGIPAARIMLLTGHTTEQSFFKYIRINKEENAKTLSEHPFFN